MKPSPWTLPLPACHYSNIPIPVSTGINTWAILEKFVLLNRLMMEPDVPRWALISGSLLGAYRHRKIMPWDIDGDIVTESPDRFVRALKEKLAAARLGDQFEFVQAKKDIIFTWRSSKRCAIANEVPFHIDIHPLHYYELWFNIPVGTMLKNACSCELNYIQLPCFQEKDTELALLKLFGKTWATPDPSKYINISNKMEKHLIDCIYSHNLP